MRGPGYERHHTSALSNAFPALPRVVTVIVPYAQSPAFRSHLQTGRQAANTGRLVRGSHVFLTASRPLISTILRSFGDLSIDIYPRWCRPIRSSGRMTWVTKHVDNSRMFITVQAVLWYVDDGVGRCIWITQVDGRKVS
jgi:hypothetical protein